MSPFLSLVLKAKFTSVLRLEEEVWNQDPNARHVLARNATANEANNFLPGVFIEYITSLMQT